MARTARLTIYVEPALKEELEDMARKMNTPTSTFLDMLLSIALNASGNTFAAFGNTREGLKAADDEHDSKK